jgi:hypothetical protein
VARHHEAASRPSVVWFDTSASVIQSGVKRTSTDFATRLSSAA